MTGFNISHSEDFMYFITCNGTVVKTCESFLEMTGYSKKDFIGNKVEVICKLLKINSPTKLKTVGYKKDYRLVTKDGNTINVHITFRILDNEKEVIYVFERIDNITPKLYGKLDQIIEAMSDAIHIIDKNGNCLKENKEARNLYPCGIVCKREDFYEKKKIFDMDGNLIEFENLPTIRMLKGEKINNYIVHIEDDAGEKYVSVSTSPIFDDKGEMCLGVMCSRDVTDEIISLKKTENLMETQNEFFSFITHEFRTPLTTILSTIQLLDLICKDEITEKVKKYISMIKRNAYQQMRLVNNLLDVTRAESGYLKTYRRNFDMVSMTRAIIESIKQYACSKNIHVSFSSNVPEKILAIDDEKFERILLNLLSNSIKFTSPGKSIHVSVEDRGESILLKVRDEGIGIPQDKLSVIFDRFGQVGSRMTKRDEGTGIGLYLVRLLVNAVEGEIKVESTEGEGSTFEISFPASKSPESENIILSQLTDNRVVETLQVEFSSIYFE